MNINFNKPGYSLLADIEKKPEPVIITSSNTQSEGGRFVYVKEIGRCAFHHLMEGIQKIGFVVRCFFRYKFHAFKVISIKSKLENNIKNIENIYDQMIVNKVNSEHLSDFDRFHNQASHIQLEEDLGNSTIRVLKEQSQELQDLKDLVEKINIFHHELMLLATRAISENDFETFTNINQKLEDYTYIIEKNSLRSERLNQKLHQSVAFLKIVLKVALQRYYLLDNSIERKAINFLSKSLSLFQTNYEKIEITRILNEFIHTSEEQFAYSKSASNMYKFILELGQRRMLSLEHTEKYAMLFLELHMAYRNFEMALHSEKSNKERIDALCEFFEGTQGERFKNSHEQFFREFSNIQLLFNLLSNPKSIHAQSFNRLGLDCFSCTTQNFNWMGMVDKYLRKYGLMTALVDNLVKKSSELGLNEERLIHIKDQINRDGLDLNHIV